MCAVLERQRQRGLVLFREAAYKKIVTVQPIPEEDGGGFMAHLEGLNPFYYRADGDTEIEAIEHLANAMPCFDALEEQKQTEFFQMQEREARLREALQSVIKSDKTREYNYGEKRRDGEAPGTGQRWLTPKELAREALADAPATADEVRDALKQGLDACRELREVRKPTDEMMRTPFDI